MGTRGRECTVCARADVGDVERALAAPGARRREVARAFGIDEATLRRHDAHRGKVAPKPLMRAGGPSVVPPAEHHSLEPDLPLGDLEGRFSQLARTADRLRVAAENGTLRERGAALGEARRTVESMAEIHERLTEGREIKIIRSAEWAAARTAIVEELGAVPGGLEALLRAEARCS